MISLNFDLDNRRVSFVVQTEGEGAIPTILPKLNSITGTNKTTILVTTPAMLAKVALRLYAPDHPSEVLVFCGHWYWMDVALKAFHTQKPTVILYTEPSVLLPQWWVIPKTNFLRAEEFWNIPTSLIVSHIVNLHIAKNQALQQTTT